MSSRTSNKLTRKQVTRRIRFLSVLVLVVGLSLLGRLYFLQVMQGPVYAEEASGQYSTESSNDERGTIYFSRATDSLTEPDTLRAAYQKTGYVLAVDATKIANPESVYEKLSTVIDLDRAEFISEAESDDSYIEIHNTLSREDASSIDELGLLGVYTVPEKERVYPGGDLAANVLGFLGYEKEGGDKRRGMYGIEREFEAVLARDNESDVNFFARAFSELKSLVSDDALREGDVVLTIDPEVQGYLEEVLMDVNQKYSSNRTMGIIMDPNTGAIRAMAVVPTFDPNEYGQAGSLSIYDNPLVSSRFEMGSIIKPLTVAAGLDTGVITPRTTYDDEGCITVNTERMCNYDGVARGVVPMQEVLNQSLNTGAAFIADKLGHDLMREYFTEKYAFGELTGVDLPNEVSSALSSLSVNRDLEYATASFGHGIALSPIATIRALATLGNGGYLVTPHVVSRIEYPNDPPEVFEHSKEEQVLKPSTSEEISRMLATVMDDAVLGGTVSKEHHSIGAKTGTAQIPSPDGGYYENSYNHTYFGSVPAYDPDYVILLMTLDPKGVRYASESLTTAFMDTVEYLINHYNISPDR